MARKDLPGPVVARPVAAGQNGFDFEFPDAEAKRCMAEFLAFAVRGGYAVQLSLVEYEGEPDMAAQAAARRTRKGVQ